MTPRRPNTRPSQPDTSATFAEGERSLSRLETLATVSRVFAEVESDLPALLSTIAEQLAARFGDTCAITLPAAGRRLGPEEKFAVPVVFDKDAEANRLLQSMGRDACQSAEDNGVPFLDDAIVREVARSGRLLVEQRRQPSRLPIFGHPSYRTWLDRFPIAGAMAVPLRVGERVTGVVVCTRRARRGAYTHEDGEVLQEVADRAAVAIENAQLVAELNAANAEMDVLYELTDAVNRAESLDGVYAPALAAILQQLRLERCALLLFDPDGVLRFKAWRGLSDEYRQVVEGHIPGRRDQANPAVKTITDVRQEPLLAACQAVFETEGIRALTFIPLANRGKLLGKFMLCSAESRGFSPAEIRLAQTTADQVAAAVGQKQLQAEREQLIEQLTRTVKLNELLAGILSHDLRNPLGAMLMSATVLTRKIADPNLARTASRILTAGQRMNRMIAQLLDFTRVRGTASLPVERTRTDLETVFRQAIEEASTGGTISIEFATEGDTRGWWDADRLAQVAMNLVSNALRHSNPGGRVTIRVDGREPDWVTSSVTNAGTIAQEALAVLFEPAQPGKTRDRAGGLGLGLFIGRELIVAHGGRMEATSKDDVTTLLMRLPRGIATAPSLTAPAFRDS